MFTGICARVFFQKWPKNPQKNTQMSRKKRQIRKDLAALLRNPKLAGAAILEHELSEAAHQRGVVSHCRLILPAYGRAVFSVPNERVFRGSAGARAGQWAQLQATGAESGVPDLLIPGLTPTGRGGIALEMKRTKGSSTSPLQWAWLLHFAALGWYAVRCKGEAEAIAVIKGAGYV